MEVNIQFQRTAEDLNKCDGTGLGCLAQEPAFFYQVRGDDPIHNSEHLTLIAGWLARQAYLKRPDVINRIFSMVRIQ